MPYIRPRRHCPCAQQVFVTPKLEVNGGSVQTRQWLLRRNVIWNDMRCCVAHDTPETEIACEWLALELSAHSLLPILECIKIDHFNDANIVAINALLLTVWKKRKSLTL